MPIFHDIVESSPPGLGGEEPRVAELEGQNPKERAGTDKRERTPPDMTLLATDSRPLSRGELIERLKRGESPTWTMRHGLGRISPDRTTPQVSPRQSPPATLLPSVEFKENVQNQQDVLLDNNLAGLEIERPRSALHSGDFRDDKETSPSQDDSSTTLATSPVAPWHPQFPAFMAPRSYESQAQSRSRAASQSSFANFVLMPPTSPLVQASNNPDLDFTSQPIPQGRRPKSPQKENRRHTFSPHSFQTFRSSPFSQHSAFAQPLAALRREGTFPYQAHQPRRSVSNQIGSQSISTPHTPLLRPRGSSNASEMSPLHHAPMVGSYEESILRGRMSTTPSRPLNFVAQIGVLGRGLCKSSLKCPPHMIVSFPAFFYSYDSGNGLISDNQPSPYVGHIDLENMLPSEEQEYDGRRRRRYASPRGDDDEDQNSYNSPSYYADPHKLALRRKKERLKRRSQSPKTPPGRSYRIPQQGQLQIIIKNPNKTAVKLFLVPYDLSDMEPGQKTFIRQRSYSAGPIIDMPVTARSNFGTDRPEAALSSSEDPHDRPVLRYLIHLNICCPSKGRYFLYKSIRVVFANRVPDGKEKLRNEVQFPTPERYGVYKPTCDSHATSGVGFATSASALAAERVARRRSTPYALTPSIVDGVDVIDWDTPPQKQGFKIKPIPFTLSGLEPLESRPASREQMDLDSPFRSRTGLSELSMSPPPAPSIRRNDPSTAWLERRENPCLGSARTAGTGLLARQLRDLSVERDEEESIAR